MQTYLTCSTFIWFVLLLSLWYYLRNLCLDFIRAIHYVKIVQTTCISLILDTAFTTIATTTTTFTVDNDALTAGFLLY